MLTKLKDCIVSVVTCLMKSTERQLGQAASGLYKAASTLFACQDSVADNVVLEDCQALQAHGDLLATASEIQSFESVAAFVLADQKDDASSRRLHSHWKKCNEQATKYPQLQHIRQLAWDFLTQVVAEKQKSVDAALLAEMEVLRPLRLGAEAGGSWKENAPPSADFEKVTAAGHEHLFVEGRGGKLQLAYKKALQASKLPHLIAQTPRVWPRVRISLALV